MSLVFHATRWRMSFGIALVSALTVILAAPVGGVSGAVDDIFNGYLNDVQLNAVLTDLAAHPKCDMEVIGASRRGRELVALTLSENLTTAADHPALLVVAGLDGRHMVGTETAYRVARVLLDDHADILDEMTVYIIPRVNPDAAEFNLGPVNAGHITNMRVVDNDRDGSVDEDGPFDVNKDGVISTMRRLNPPLDDPATHLTDPDEPRLLKKPDAIEGERAAYSLYIEGLDADGDGRIGEDPIGGVDLDRNFPHLWSEYESDTGPTQLSEPESLAVAKFVINHRNIVMAVTYGRHDNLVHAASDTGRDKSGQAPKGIDEGDVAVYKKISELYGEITGQKNAPSEDNAGSFHAWLYAQRGLPSFAITVWGRPEEEGDNGKDDAANGGKQGDTTGNDSDLTPSPVGDISMETLDDLRAAAEAAGFPVDDSMIDQLTPAMVEQFAGRMGVEVRRVSKGTGGTGGSGGGGDNAEDIAWLAYSDSRNGAGFIDWSPFDHPTLGAVEIGGFVPGFKMNPPAAELDDLAAAQTEFLVALISKRPRVSIDGPSVKKLAPGLYDIRIAIVNGGFLPTTTSHARTARSVPPLVVRISTPVENIVTGQRVTTSWGIDGNGGRLEQHWIVRAEDGSDISIQIVNAMLGDQTIAVIADDDTVE